MNPGLDRGLSLWIRVAHDDKVRTVHVELAQLDFYFYLRLVDFKFEEVVLDELHQVGLIRRQPRSKAFRTQFPYITTELVCRVLLDHSERGRSRGPGELLQLVESGIRKVDTSTIKSE